MSHSDEEIGQKNGAVKGAVKRNYSPEGDDEHESSGRNDNKRTKKSGKAQKAIVEKSANVVKGRKERKQLKININMNSVTGAPVSAVQNHNPYQKVEPAGLI